VIKAEFSASLLQSSVSQMLPLISLICWSDAQKTFIEYYSVENSYIFCGKLYRYFCGKFDNFVLRIHCWIQSEIKKQYLFETEIIKTEIICNNVKKQSMNTTNNFLHYHMLQV